MYFCATKANTIQRIEKQQDNTIIYDRKKRPYTQEQAFGLSAQT